MDHTCPFAITLRYDPEDIGEFWIVGDSYEPNRCCHSHSFKPPDAVVKKPVFVEERIDTDNDSYGDEEMRFEDASQA